MVPEYPPLTDGQLRLLLRLVVIAQGELVAETMSPSVFQRLNDGFRKIYAESGDLEADTFGLESALEELNRAVRAARGEDQ